MGYLGGKKGRLKRGGSIQRIYEERGENSPSSGHYPSKKNTRSIINCETLPQYNLQAMEDNTFAHLNLDFQSPPPILSPAVHSPQGTSASQGGVRLIYIYIYH